MMHVRHSSVIQQKQKKERSLVCSMFYITSQIMDRSKCRMIQIREENFEISNMSKDYSGQLRYYDNRMIKSVYRQAIFFCCFKEDRTEWMTPIYYFENIPDSAQIYVEKIAHEFIPIGIYIPVSIYRYSYIGIYLLIDFRFLSFRFTASKLSRCLVTIYHNHQ